MSGQFARALNRGLVPSRANCIEQWVGDWRGKNINSPPVSAAPRAAANLASYAIGAQHRKLVFNVRVSRFASRRLAIFLEAAPKMGIRLTEHDVLLVVDVQNDFCPGGRLPVPHGDEVVPIINRIARRFGHVVLTQDWHPPGHSSFASSHPGEQPFETIEVAYGPQVLWPDHCVQCTPGAAFRADLEIPHAELILRKGFRPLIDSYSAFFENDHVTPTGLAGYLRERRFVRVFLTGLAFDFCVRYSAEDAVAHAINAVIIEDACRAIDLGGSVAKTRASFCERNIFCIASDVVG